MEAFTTPNVLDTTDNGRSDLDTELNDSNIVEGTQTSGQENLPQSVLQTPMPIASATSTHGAEDDALQLARDGNPDFIYETLYTPGTKQECPSFKCFKCPTSVDRMDRLDSHYRSHGANKKYKCKFCDFSVDQMHVVIRHEEGHRMQKQKKQASLEKDVTKLQPVSTPEAETTSAIGRSQSHASGKRSLESVVNNVARVRSPETPPLPADDESMKSDSDIEVDIDSDEAVNVDIDSEEEMELEEEQAKPGLEAATTTTMEKKSPTISTPLKNRDRNIRQTSVSKSAKGARRQLSKCQFCPAKFKFPSFRKRHELLHSGKRPLACPFCTYSTTTRYALQEHVVLHDTESLLNPPSPAKSISDSECSAKSTGKRSSVGSRRQSQRSNSNDDDDNADLFEDQLELDRLRKGNPEFKYYKKFRNVGNNRVEIPTYKCMTCPTAYTALRDLEKHHLRHGDKKGVYACKICDYSHDLKPCFERHLEYHSSQNEMSSHGVERDRKGGFDIGNSSEVAIVGNENDFEIEYENAEAEDEEADVSIDSVEMKEIPVPKTVTQRRSCEQRQKVMIDVKPLPESVSIVTSSTKNDFDIYDVQLLEVETKKNRNETYLLSSMKLTNFMCFEDISFNLNSDAVTFSGGEGKSTSIIAILLCLGYDLLDETHTPSVICGWEISDLIKRGHEIAWIEITLCLKSYPTLSEEFGKELKIRRTLRRGVPLSASTFHLNSSALDGCGSPKAVGIQRLRGILSDLSIFPLYSRMLLLDKQNLKVVMNDRDSWYEYFTDAMKQKGKLLKANLERLTPLFDRLEGDLNWRRAELRFLEEQLMTDYPIEKDPAFQQWRDEDVKRRRQVELDIEALMKKYDNLEHWTASYTEQLANIPSVVLKEMRTIYLEFLASQNCIGDILVDETSNRLRIWVREKGSLDEEIPINVLEADVSWGKMQQGKRQLGTFGLYLGFWKVHDACPFFAVDAFSSAELEFKFPSKGLPVLMRLVRSKSGQQFLMSYPESS